MMELDPIDLFPFELDEFQHQAIAALGAGQSVVVCAPTGSGKTLIGEYAIHRALSIQKRVFYTTPLKALSNQKLRDFRDRFGIDQVGLLTGDVSVNRDAPILVMTTEIFRNMLYGTAIGAVGTSLVDVQAVVLDECHYMNDRQRGTVWEESIIYCPPEIQLVALSATVDNSEQLTDWIGQVHGPTQLIYSDYRPVPLEILYCRPNGLFPLLNQNQKRLNPRLKPKSGKRRQQTAPSYAYVVGQLYKREMLPAIYFIFSRRGCDQAVAELAQTTLITPEEEAQLRSYIDPFLARNPDAVRAGQLEPLYRGVAAHHAGILPAWKALVEELFQQGLIKVVFATETLAAGINMPARTTVISSLSKRTDRGHRLLNASEFLQMAGRAGRRGMDEQGYVVTVQTRFEGASEAAYLATSRPDPLVSQFTPSYGMVLNLLQTHTLEEAQDLVERSFGQYLATLQLQPQLQAIADLDADIAHQEAQLAHIDQSVLNSYQKLKERLREERRLLKILEEQADELRFTELAQTLNFTIAGTILSLKGKHVPVAVPITAVLVTKVASNGKLPYLVCLGQDNRWYVATVDDVIQLHADAPRLAEVDTLNPPSNLALHAGQVRQGDETTADLVTKIPDLPVEIPIAPEVDEYRANISELDSQLSQHPAHQFGNPTNLLKRQRRIAKLHEKLSDRQTKLENYTHRYWQEFLDLLAILQQCEALDGTVPTQLGEIAAALRGDNELWLGIALASKELDQLTAPQLATTCGALVTEISRPDAWTRYQPSPEVEEVLGGLRSDRHRLFRLQRRYIVNLPAWMEIDCIGIVEQWANGETWSELCANTSLDEGDLVRILRRTADFLSQIPHVPHISSQLKQTARDAIRAIDRFPVSELLPVSPLEDDLDENLTDEASDEDPEELEDFEDSEEILSSENDDLG